MAGDIFDQKNFFLNVLRSGLKDDSITDVKIVDSSYNNQKKGQNFMSSVSEVTLEYTHLPSNSSSSNAITDTIYLFIKRAIPDGTHKLLFEKDVFEIETEILSRVLPEIEQIVGIKTGPKFIFHLKEPPTIILENLSKFQFRNKNQKLGLSKDHVVMVVETIAQYHAGSVAFDEKQPGYLQQFNQTLFGGHTHQNFLKMIGESFEELGKAMFNWPDPNCVKVAFKIQNLAKSVIDSCKTNIHPDKDEFCVLNHGDCWINNIMFRENDANQPLDIRLIDFQLPIWASPALDLQYLFALAPAFDIKYKLDDFFLEKYLTMLKKTMEKLNCTRKPPTWDELKSSMWKLRCLALVSGLVFYPKVMVKVEDVGTIKDVIDNKVDTKVNIYVTPEVIEKFSKLIPMLDERGYLD